MVNVMKKIKMVIKKEDYERLNWKTIEKKRKEFDTTNTEEYCKKLSEYFEDILDSYEFIII